MKMPPCGGCPDRRVEPNCHCTCEKYIAWAAMNEAAKKRRDDDLEHTHYNYDKSERLYKRTGWRREGQR